MVYLERCGKQSIFLNSNMRHIILSFLFFLNFSSCITCNKIVQDLRPIEYSLKGQGVGRHENRFFLIFGIDNCGEHKCIKIPYFWEIEENYQPGGLYSQEERRN